MKKSRYGDAQKLGVIKQAQAGRPLSALAQAVSEFRDPKLTGLLHRFSFEALPLA